MASDLSREEQFETEICEYLAAHGWLYSPSDAGYDTERALFPKDVLGWLTDTQPEQLAKVVKAGSVSESKQREQVLDAITKRLDAPMSHGGGMLNVLRRPVSHVNATLRMCQFKPATMLNPKTVEDYEKVRLRVMRQVHFSPDKGDNRAIDLVFFVNGLPVATLELKTYFKQEVHSAIDQYKQDRSPKGQPLLGHGNRALVHFAVDDDEVWMTTRLAGAKTFFLPFNRGTVDGGKGNPPNPNGEATAYLWERVLQRDSWLNILGALMFTRHEEKVDPISGKKSKKSTILFPRFHQWEAVTSLVEAARTEGPGHKYLIQHSAGSGKTNSIAWTAHRLARLHNSNNAKVFDTVLVLTDRTVLDDQLQEAVRQVDNQPNLVVTIDETETRRAGGSKSKALAAALQDKRLIVVVTIQTFPFVMKELTENKALAGHSFAIIVDEAHTSQSGATATEVRKVLSAGGVEVEEPVPVDGEDVLNAEIARQTAQRANPKNISYFAFTATPKDKTLQLFGRRDEDGLPRAFHVYSMRQAIEEEFILDVLRGYQTYSTAFEIETSAKGGVIATTHSTDEAADGNLVEESAAARGIMRFVKLHPSNIGQKVEIIVEHFRANVAHLLEGHAKAMVVTDSRIAAVRYKAEIDAYVKKKGYDLRTLVAFSGTVDDPDYAIERATEASMNPGARRDLAEEFKGSAYRVMIVADKFQTGFDQPLLCAMYVDKTLGRIDAVQTLSRLNRTYQSPVGEKKERTFVLDFANKPADIQASFEPYYREARIESTTDPNIVHEIAAKLAEADIYTDDDVEAFAHAWFTRAGHGALSATIQGPKDRFAALYKSAKKRDDKAEILRLELFRKDVGTFVRLYDFMSQIVDYENTALEKLSVFLRQFARVIMTDRLTSVVDLSDVTLKRIKHIDRGKSDLSLGAERTLKPASEAGSGSASRDPKLVALAEVVSRINSLFAGEFEAGSVEGFVKSAASEVISDPEVAEEIDANELDQFRKSPTLPTKVIDAVLDVPGVMEKMAGRVVGDADLVDLIAQAAYLLHKIGQDQRQSDGGEESDA
ncbi:DEAD/DEAH box helicase family protein [Streptomyces sp. S1A]|uniref:type I restriction endonuclease subunit R n=1 Tax=Streptomyces sp. ICN903 TaxID=2964654 RepID=UPI001EDA9DDA|nr:DEAD/DEAH box helicase family protein [Streptomyces sp. ICN903]MCG3040985.1 DEAD/DEAH box helicase family protein [Streptomyces sp. ICN903]